MGSGFPHEAMKQRMIMYVTSFIICSTPENFSDQNFLFKRKKS